ncbi:MULTISPECIES: thiamine phosphate synthase [unclassified Paenibacillus]|uniref:thiamine phosphate synthase n=1 Tax=unclassified Paenibacillus TaxID=185978 RepID=UPI00095713D6|nr:MULTISPECIES: thiamine phosphate synthase [unclassified Paenibacillus]ASS68973.1 thiamine phosphate synthase [Paenibacillus sp. RUD330]SIR12674.1 thiamine-phosphate pyrophosphorylase [Paenibacillus sp. RU4X]SIR24749.1 thiamine-phosphate pyrophosphorylase [Paenibacillus sp. RU4T]
MKKLEFSLYVITGEGCHPGRRLEDVMRETLEGGADILQLRDKKASLRELGEKAGLLRRLTREYGVPFIVNDHPLLALESDADGVHLGQDDLSIADARELLGPERIVGISTHSLEQALKAETAGADYIGVGPVYPTATKPGRAAVTLDYVRQAARHVRIPWTAIGGIHPGNAGEVLAAGARRLCAVSAVVGSSDPAAVCRELRSLIAAASEAAAGLNASSGAASRPGSPLRLTLNGKEILTPSATLQELVESHGLSGQRIVAEADGIILPRGDWSRHRLADGMKIELVHFVGGG